MVLGDTGLGSVVSLRSQHDGGRYLPKLSSAFVSLVTVMPVLVSALTYG
jgi:hypothetical protein